MGPSAEGDGLELWRRLFKEYQGSDELTNLAGRTKLLEFPQCKQLKRLNHHLDEWLELLHKFGGDMGPVTVQTLFLKTRPDSMRSEVFKRPELKELEPVKLADWARNQTSWERSKELAGQMLRSEKVMPVIHQRLEPGAAT